MSKRSVSVSVPDEQLFEIAKRTLGIAGISANSLINAALRLYKGEDRDIVINDVQPRSNLVGQHHDAKVPVELLEGVNNVTYAARVGLGMAMLMTREQAEKWASQFSYSHGGKREGAGRPRKEKVNHNVS